MPKDWIGNLSKGDSVVVRLGPWDPERYKGQVTQVQHEPSVRIEVQLDAETMSFDGQGMEVTPWRTMDGAFLQEASTLH